MALRSEEDGRVLLDSPIQRDDVYQRQEDTLIVWTETDGTDFALSFQDIQGCLDIWENINDLQRRLQSMADIRPSTDGSFKFSHSADPFYRRCSSRTR